LRKKIAEHFFPAFFRPQKSSPFSSSSSSWLFLMSFRALFCCTCDGTLFVRACQPSEVQNRGDCSFSFLEPKMIVCMSGSIKALKILGVNH
jgi:hypothetical protein